MTKSSIILAIIVLLLLLAAGLFGCSKSTEDMYKPEYQAITERMYSYDSKGNLLSVRVTMHYHEPQYDLTSLKKHVNITYPFCVGSTDSLRMTLSKDTCKHY